MLTRFAVLCLLSGAFLVAAEDPLPPGAVKTGPNTWTFTGKDGKKKVATKTPFGIAVNDADAPKEPPRQRADHSLVRVEQKGDVIVFRRQTPFGDSVWRRKRSELNDIEKEILEAKKSAPTPEKGASQKAKK